MIQSDLPGDWKFHFKCGNLHLLATDMNTTDMEQLKRSLSLTQRQKEIIIGKLLGDGHLETQNRGRTFRLKIEHAITQRPYVDWLAQELGSWLNQPPRSWTRMVQGMQYTKYGFQTLSHPALRFFAHQWYHQGRKIIPPQINRWLTPLAFAVWYMDDGSVKSNQTNGRILNTQGFTRQEVDQLIQVINNRYQLSAVPRRQREGWQIFIPAHDAQRLTEILKPHLHSMFRYKLPKLKETPMPKM